MPRTDPPVAPPFRQGQRGEVAWADWVHAQVEAQWSEKLAAAGLDAATAADIADPASDTRVAGDALWGAWCDVRSKGAVPGGVVPCAVAFAEAEATGRTVVIPPGVWNVTGWAPATDATIVGGGIGRTILVSTSGPVMTLAGSAINVSDLTIYATGDHAVVQSGSISQCHWSRARLIQTHNNYSAWDNAGYEFVDMRFDNGSSSHTQAATVATWALSAVGGCINANVWQQWRADRSGNYHWSIESTNANAQYGATWRDITFEVCTGGGIKMRSVRGYLIDGFANWDMASGTPSTGQRHFIDAGANASSIPCIGKIREGQRLAGVNESGVYDVVLPANGLGNGTILEALRNPSGADPFTVDCRSQYTVISNPHGTLASYLNSEASSFLPDALGTIRLATASITAGTGSPEGVVTAVPGSTFMRTDGSAGATTYLKRTGTGNTGWAAVASATELAGKVDTAAWTAYTPALGGAGTSLGNGTAVGAWVNLGGVVEFYASVTLGSTTVIGTDVQVGLPVAMYDAAVGSYATLSGVATDTGSNSYVCTGLMASTTMVAMFTTAGGLAPVNATTPHTWAATDVIELRGTYRPA